jgi:hypothetical protein
MTKAESIAVGKARRIKYQIEGRRNAPNPLGIDGKVEQIRWITCQQAQVEPSGWLSYTLADGTVGLKRPRTWRVKPE